MDKKINWLEIKQYLLKDPDCKNIHKMVWGDHAFLTDKFGERYEIKDWHSIEYVKSIVRKVKERNGSPKYYQ